MIAGRGLGHTGGTLDKLEAIAGFRTHLTASEFAHHVRNVGACIMGQTDAIAPADRAMYALRDVTATVESLPLIVASILSKKLAVGLDAIVFDVKVGRGAFLPSLAQARDLATALVQGVSQRGQRAVALLTDMDTPLGLTIGNALETREAMEVLHNRGPADLVACTFALGAEMLVLAGRASTIEHAHAVLRAARSSGDGADVFRRMVAAQGGDPRVVDDPTLLPTATVIETIFASHSGWVDDVHPKELALAAVELGAGRQTPGASLYPEVGFELCVQRGSPVTAGQPLVRIHGRSLEAVRQAQSRVIAAVRITDEGPPLLGPLVRDRIVALPHQSALADVAISKSHASCGEGKAHCRPVGSPLRPAGHGELALSRHPRRNAVRARGNVLAFPIGGKCDVSTRRPGVGFRGDSERAFGRAATFADHHDPAGQSSAGRHLCFGGQRAGPGVS